jgi:hypothetical protein
MDLSHGGVMAEAEHPTRSSLHQVEFVEVQRKLSKRCLLLGQHKKMTKRHER